MSIQVGDRMPSATLRRLGAEGPEQIDSASFVAGRKVIWIGVVGAYTGTCHNDHLPSFINNIDAIRAKGVDEVVCAPVNDMFVLANWGKDLGAEGKVTFLSDGNAELARALGLEMDGSGFGLGTRCKRFALVLEDGVVKAMEIEESPGTCSVTSGTSLLESL